VIVVSGYHGFGNLGDEAILAVLCEDLASLGIPRADILVLSGDPGSTSKAYGVQSLERYALGKIWNAIGSAQLLVSGGGSLFQDVTSKRSIPYYLAIIEMAFRRGVPVALYGHGIGPISMRTYRKLVARAFLKSAGFTLRDAFSAQLLRSLKVPVPESAVAVDPVFQLETSDVPPEIRDVPTIGLNLRPYPGWKGQISTWAKVLQELLGAGWALRFIPIGPGDEELGVALQGKVPGLELGPRLELASFRQDLSELDMFISMRLHGVILGALSGTIPIALNYDPKIHAVCAQIGCRCVELVELKLVPRIAGDVVRNYAMNHTEQAAQLERLRQSAYRNREMLRQVLEG